MTGLIGWWPLHENSGDKAYDLSGNGNHGSLNGGVTQGVAGKGGLTAYSFDGSDDYVSMGDFFDAPSSLTLSTWVKFDSTPNSRSTVITKGGSGDDSYSLTWNPDDGGINFYVDDSNGNSSDATFKSPQTGVWYHILGAYDGETARIFVNGELKGSSSNASGSLVSNTNPVTIARRGNNSQWHLDGNVADVRIYNRALTSQEIQTLYEWGNGDYARPPDSNNGGISRWKLDGAVDDSYGSNSGTNNGVTFTDGVDGQAGSFANGDYIGIGDSLDFGTSSFSISTWINPAPDESTKYYYIVSKGNSPGYLLRINSDDTVTGRISDGSGTVSTVSRETISNNNWYHLTYAVNRNDNNSRIYINGVQQDSADISAIGDITNSGSFEIGRVDGTSGPYEGLIDDVRIYSKALNPKEIFELYRWGTKGRDLRKFTVNTR